MHFMQVIPYHPLGMASIIVYTMRVIDVHKSLVSLEKLGSQSFCPLEEVRIYNYFAVIHSKVRLINLVFLRLYRPSSSTKASEPRTPPKSAIPTTRLHHLIP